jgi:ubiquinone/menaquinone biosynthesis C-methylase UbiE
MKAGEQDYLKNLGEAGIRHARGKPFSDKDCGLYLVDMGRVLWHLSVCPGGAVLDLGVGTGWTSLFLGAAGFEVTGMDISADMIAVAERNRAQLGLTNVCFLAGDFEGLSGHEVYDAVLFYDSLHHAIDERAALLGAFRALKPGGICITYEPGSGHSAMERSRQAVAAYGVTEKDMPPSRIMALGESVGFSTRQLVAYQYSGAQLKQQGNAFKKWRNKMRRCWEILSGPDLYDREVERRNIVLLKK